MLDEIGKVVVLLKLFNKRIKIVDKDYEFELKKLEMKSKLDNCDETDNNKVINEILSGLTFPILGVGLTLIVFIESILVAFFFKSFVTFYEYFSFVSQAKTTTDDIAFEITSKNLKLISKFDLFVVMLFFALLLLMGILFYIDYKNRKIDESKRLLAFSVIEKNKLEQNIEIFGGTLSNQVANSLSLSQEHLLYKLCENIVNSSKAVVACSTYDYKESHQNGNVTFIIKNISNYSLHDTRANVISKEIYQFNSRHFNKYNDLLDKMKKINKKIYLEVEDYLKFNLLEKNITPSLVKSEANSKGHEIISESLSDEFSSFYFDSMEFIRSLQLELISEYDEHVRDMYEVLGRLINREGQNNLLDFYREIDNFRIRLRSIQVSNINLFSYYSEESSSEYDDDISNIISFISVMCDSNYKYNITLINETFNIILGLPEIDKIVKRAFVNTEIYEYFIDSMGRYVLPSDNINDDFIGPRDIYDSLDEIEYLKQYEFLREVFDTSVIATNHMATQRAMLNAIIMITVDGITNNGLNLPLDWELRKLQRNGVMTSILMKDIYFCKHEGKSDKNGRLYFFIPININYKQIIFTLSVDFSVLTENAGEGLYLEYAEKLKNSIMNQVELFAKQSNARIEFGYKDI